MIATIVLTASLSASGSWKAEQINVEWDENSIGMSIERITCSSDGSIYATGGNVISQIKPDAEGNWILKSIAGGKPGFKDDIGIAAQFKNPLGIACDSKDKLYVFDVGNQAIRKLISTYDVWNVSTFWKASNTTESFRYTGMMTSDSNDNLYIVGESQVDDKRSLIFKKIDSSGNVTKTSYTDVQFNPLTGIACDDSGNLYVTGIKKDPIWGLLDNQTMVYKINTSSDPAELTLIDDTNFNLSGIAYDKRTGDLYVTDVVNKLISQLAYDKKTDSWAVSTVEDLTNLPPFNYPHEAAVNSKGELFVVDSGRLTTKFTFVKDETAPSEEELAEENRLAEEAEQEKKAAAAEEAKQKADKEEAKLKAAKYRAEERAKRNAAKAKFKAREEAKREAVNGGAWHVVSEFIWHPVKSIQSIWSALSFWWCS